jgi:Cu2+-exporting ATPase
MKTPPPGGPTPAAPEEATAQEQDADEVNRNINLYLGVSIGSLGLGVAGALLYPPLTVISVAGSLYAVLPLVRLASRAIFVEHRPRAAILDSFASVSALVGGFFVVTAVGNTTYYAGRKLLLKTKDRSRKNLVDIFGDQQRSAWLLRDGVEIEVPIERLHAADVVVVNAGQVVPVDGIIRQGLASIDQHQLTGEAQPVEKGEGEQVLAATMVLAGRICVEVERAGAITVAAQIGEILNQTADYRTHVESRGERFGDQCVLPMIGLAALALAAVGPAGAIAVLASNFTENIRVALPLGMLNYLSQAAERAILIKDGRALELLSAVDTVVFDKTGTLTMEQPSVGEIHTFDGADADTVLCYAAAAEARQSHPIARAIVQRASERGLSMPALEHARYRVGYGIEAEISGRQVRVGSARFMRLCEIVLPDELDRQATRAHELGNSLVYVAVEQRLTGVIELRPSLPEGIREVIDALRAHGLALSIISGDHEEPTRRLASELGIERHFAEVLPADKAALIKGLQAEGHKVCFVGDGINDAIALKTADASISLRGATSAATDTAQIVMMDGTLRRLPELFTLARNFDRNARLVALMALLPAVVSVGGVFFFEFGILAALVAYNASLVASVGSAMLPALLRKRRGEGSGGAAALPEAPPHP